MAVAFLGLAVALQAVARRVEQLGHQGAARLVPLLLQCLGQMPHALAGPPQRRLGIAAARWFDQRIEIAKQGRVPRFREGRLLTIAGLRPAPGRRTRSNGSSWANSFRPRPIVLGAMPVAFATAVMPPYPAANASAAASGATVRLDSTVTAALMHEPSDSTLLSDAVRVMTRLLRRGGALPGTPAVQWRDRRRLAKKRARAVEYSRGQDKKRQLYRELIAAAEASRDELQAMATGLAEAAEIATERWRAEVAQYLPLIVRVIVQTRRRVLDGEIVPASEKLVSLFEPHADIIVKGGRQVQYGHKLNLTTGKSGLILDVVIETGNPADAERFVSMLDRHIARTGAAPRQTAADGGYASRANLAAAKARGVADVAFHKKCGIAITEMVKSPWVYRRLRNFRPASRRRTPAS